MEKMTNNLSALYGVSVLPVTTDYIVIARLAGENQIFTFIDLCTAREYAEKLDGVVFRIFYDDKNNSYCLDKILKKKEKKNEKI